jgi:hypothetical protein
MTFSSPILDVAIGMIFIYLSMSLICSAINEMIEAKLKNRATDLEKGIRELFAEQDVGSPEQKPDTAVTADQKDKTPIVQQLYAHPLVNGLFRGGYDAKPIVWSSYWRSTNLPSYIPNKNFAAALLDVVVNPSESTSSSVITIETLRSAVSKMQNATVKRALDSFLATARGDIDKVRGNIEAWFDSSMERVAGWYKRRTQWILLILGLAVTIALNVNTLTVAQRLWTDPVLRTSIADEASAKVKAGLGDTDKRIKDNVETLEKTGLPMGWSGGFAGMYGTDKTTCPSGWVYACLRALFGWVLTAWAVSFGAPFWFDLLNKFLTIRSTVKPQEKAPESAAPTPPAATVQISGPVAPLGTGSFRPNEWAKGDAQEGIL